MKSDIIENINVTKSYLPDFDEYLNYLKIIWSSGQLTNHGNLVKELELRLKSYFNASNLVFVSNGTIAIQIAIKALNIKKEIITTPFSYVATTSSIVWEGCKPIFVDIESDNLTIDAEKIEKEINENTEAILATHVYGNPCNIEKIESIAEKYNLKVIYDAAHSFGVKYNDIDLINYGDISTISFHATKLFHTVEGGAIVTNNYELHNKISYLMNFGHKGSDEFLGVGINAKNSEFHAAMGLCNLPKVENLIKIRKEISNKYDSKLLNIKNISKPKIRPNTIYNYSYYPIIFDSEENLLSVLNNLNKNNIFPRRYFYPSLETLNYVERRNVPFSSSISKRILCLPLYHSLEEKNIDKISDLINNSII